jgi:hypothetical protein
LQITFQTSIESWKGKRIVELADMASVAESLQAIVDSGELALGLRTRRFDPQLAIPLTDDTSECLQVAADVLLQLDDLRELAIRYGRDLRIREPKAYRPNESEWWRIARQILEGDSVTAPSGELTFRGQFEAGLEGTLSAQGQQVFFVRNAPLTVTACGEVICTIPIDAMMKDYEVQISKEANDVQALRMRRRPDSVLVIRRTSDAPFDMDGAALTLEHLGGD